MALAVLGNPSRALGITVSQLYCTASIWVTLVLTQTPHRRRMPNAKTLVTALNIRVQYTTGNGRLALDVISISQGALSVRQLSTEY
jgi:hypothetical protein